MFLKKLLKILSVLTGAALLANSAHLVLTTNFNFGNIAVAAAGIGFVLCAANLRVKMLKVIRAAFLGVMAVCTLLCVFLYICGVNDTADFDENVLIVLGAGVRGDRPTLALKKRLDAASDFSRKNPDAVIIVSGAKGAQESVTEAYAMKKYLVEKGVDGNRIIEEDGARNTAENFKYSKQIADGIFKDKPYKTAFATNAFHVFRSEKLAKSAGFEDITHIHGGFVWYLVPTAYLRECAAVAYLFVFGS